MCNNLNPINLPAGPTAGNWDNLPRWVDGPRPCAVLVRDEGSPAEVSREVAIRFDGRTYLLPDGLDREERDALRGTLRHALLEDERDRHEDIPTADGCISVHLFR